MALNQTKKEVRAWSDKYQNRIDAELDTAFSELEIKLQERLEQASVKQILTGGKSWLGDEVLKPEIESWVRRHVEPIMDDAQNDLAQIVAHELDRSNRSQNLSQNDLANLLVDLGAPIAAVIGGIGGMVATVIFAINVFLGFLITINYPLLISGLIVGGVLTALGLVQASRIKSKLLKRFRNLFIPKIRSALIGKGFKQDGTHRPSLKKQLQESIKEAASAVIKEVA